MLTALSANPDPVYGTTPVEFVLEIDAPPQYGGEGRGVRI